MELDVDDLHDPVEFMYARVSGSDCVFRFGPDISRPPRSRRPPVLEVTVSDVDGGATSTAADIEDERRNSESFDGAFIRCGDLELEFSGDEGSGVSVTGSQVTYAFTEFNARDVAWLLERCRTSVQWVSDGEDLEHTAEQLRRIRTVALRLGASALADRARLLMQSLRIDPNTIDTIDM